LTTAPDSARSGLRNAVLLALLALAALLLVNSGELASLPHVLASLPLALLASLLAHLPQILLTAWAWLILLPPETRPSLGRMLQLRWYREGADALLPAGAVVGQAAVTRLMIRDGVPADLAASTATIGILLEAIGQMVFTILGLILFMTLRGDLEVSGFLLGIALAVGMVALLVALQRPMALGLLRRLLQRLARRWPRLEPLWLDRFQAALLRLHADRRALALALLLHVFAWIMGGVEILLVLHMIGHPIGLGEALVIEAFAQVLRNAGFLLPGAAGVQEGAIIAGGLLLGVPVAAMATAALVRRSREILVGGAGLLAWRRDELRGR
jgi:putative membrane protein